MGAMSGMRSMAAPALVSRLAKAGGLNLSDTKLGWLGSSGSAATTAVLALGEVVADKLPMIPARTKVGPLAGRAIAGALSGAAIASSRKRPAWVGALFGAAGAIGAAYALYYLRRAASEELHLPNPVAAVLEDAVVAGTGYLIMTKLRETQPAA
jgi:uncharacterized membrane protein